MSKPISEAQNADPRQFQIDQIKRRFSPVIKDDQSGTKLTFKLHPSDPDFPFELDGLKCDLLVPRGFPNAAKPSLRVTNAEMPRGYQINVERGFDSLARQHSQKTLLSLMNELDKRLESFLVAEKAQTIKLVANTGNKTVPTVPILPELAMADKPDVPVARQAFNAQQKVDASSKRESETRQLEARLGRHQLFAKSPDGISFIIPLQVPKPARLPASLQSLKVFKLSVPLHYNLEPCTVVLEDVDTPESHAVESSFEKRTRAHPEMSLMAHVNHLAQNMHVMTHEAPKETGEAGLVAEKEAPDATLQISCESQSKRPTAEAADTSRSHIHIIPRPPEWSLPAENSDVDDASDLYNTDESYTDGEVEGGASVVIEPGRSGPELGVLLSFPFLELYGIELLQVCSLSITIKCDRCKDTMDLKNIKSHVAENETGGRHESCKKCASPFSIGHLPPVMYFELPSVLMKWQDIVANRYTTTQHELDTSISTAARWLIFCRGV